VIDESRYWKAPLLRAANWIEKLRIQEESSGKTFVRLEREVFVGFYAIRKLLETFKISDNTRSATFDLKYSPNIKPVDYLNAHRIDELYDLSRVASESRNLEFLCNQFIHSYIFVPVIGELNEIAGLYVTSDRTRHNKLYLVEQFQVLSAFRTVGRDYPTCVKLRRNSKTRQWEGTVS
jgi:hypothetical protein